VSFPSGALAQGEEGTILITSQYNLPSSKGSVNPDGTVDIYRNVRRESADYYWVAWVSGASENPVEGIDSFPLENFWNGSYGLSFSIDFPGNYCVVVYL